MVLDLLISETKKRSFLKNAFLMQAIDNNFPVHIILFSTLESGVLIIINHKTRSIKHEP